jgi:hypothetical protein
VRNQTRVSISARATRCGRRHTRRFPPTEAHEGIPKAIIDRAWDAQVRLCRRYRRLAARGKHANTAVVAIARELSGFIWDIGRLAMSLALPSSRDAT